MEQKPNTSTRRKFFLWGLGIISSVTALKLVLPKKKKSTTVKMLTQDGRLVEIDKKLLVSSGKKISDKELQKWVKK
jgi:hypothetical protein